MPDANVEQPNPSGRYKLSLESEANLERIIGSKSKLIEMKWLKKAFEVSKSVGTFSGIIFSMISFLIPI